MLNGYILIFYSTDSEPLYTRVPKIKNQYLSTVELPKFLRKNILQHMLITQSREKLC